MQEGKRHSFVMSCDFFYMGLHDTMIFVWKIRRVYVYLNINDVIEGN
jgi:hypothetical protein